MAFLGEILPETVHEINNHLQPIAWWCGMEIERSKDARTKERLGSICAAAMQAGRLSRALLRIADARRESEAGDVSVALHHALELFGRRIEEASGRRVVRTGTDEMPPVSLSTSDLELVFANLIKNALDAGDDLRELEIRIGARCGEGQVTIEIWDSGDHIDPRDLERIFEPFFTTKPSGKGMGLGLSTCRRLVSDAGGTIRAVNEEGGGVSFVVSLPAVEAGAGSEHASQGRPSRLRGRRVLLVDDDEVVLEVVREGISVLGEARVEACTNGREALNLLQAEAFDVILLDLRMPGLSGEEVYGRLPDDVRAKVVFLTGDTVGAATREFLAATHRPYLFKPVGVDEVLDAVAEVAQG